MSTNAHEHVDQATGTATTGHVWDGIRELNTPLPRWWVWVFYATIVWSVAYWVVYPAWPLISNATAGVFGWHSRAAVEQDLEALRARRAAMMGRIGAADTQQILADPELLSFARAVGKAAFGDNCAPCHGAGGGGAVGYANLNDDDWLWGGKLADIEKTIRHGVRSADPDARQGNMPAFGRDGVLKPQDISNVADYARSLSGLPAERGYDAAAGKKLFEDNCAVCHGPEGKGNRELGAPDLTDRIWLFASDKKTIMDGIFNGRGSVMPHWGGRLDDNTIKALTVYVHTFGGGEK